MSMFIPLRSLAGRTLISRRVVKLSDVGMHNNLFGGKMMAWVDEAAASHGMIIAKSSRLVTISVDNMVFHKPAKVGDIINFYGEIERLGRTSITMKIDANKLHVSDRHETTMLSTRITFVQIDEDDRPTEIRVDREEAKLMRAELDAKKKTESE